MLKASVVEKLNTQINMEFYSSNLYLQMGAWADQKGSRARPRSCGSMPTRK